MVSCESKMEEWSLPTMSMDTMGSSVYSKMPFKGALGRGLHGGVDLLGGHGLLQLHREVDHGAVGGGNAGGEAVETALELGEHEGHGTGGTGGGGDHRHGGSAGAAQILMGKIEDLLVVGVGVDGVHVAALDAEVLQQHLGEGSQAVGGAGGVRDDVVHLGVVLVVVDAHDDGDVLVLGRAGNDDLLGAGIQVLLGQLAGLEDAGGLHDDVDPQLAPGQVRRIAIGEHGHVLAVHHQAVFHLPRYRSCGRRGWSRTSAGEQRWPCRPDR